MREEGKESARWARGIRAASSRAADPSKLIDVADREGDIYPLLAELHASGARFIIRSAQNRSVDVGDLRSHLRDVSREAPTRYTIDVPLSRRSKVKWLRHPHAPREARKATLSVATASVRLRRPQWNPKSQPETVPVHLVHVFELGPPQLESFRTLSNLLAYTLVVAYALLVMRSLTRLERKLPAIELLSETEMQVLRLATKRPLSSRPDLREAMLAIAALGGHLPSNGQPGWRILSRGWQRLRDYDAGFRMARSCDR